jgi:hypothetical protein
MDSIWLKPGLVIGKSLTIHHHASPLLVHRSCMQNQVIRWASLVAIDNMQ